MNNLTKQGLAARERPRHSQAQQNILILMHEGYMLTERRGIMNLDKGGHYYSGRVTYPSIENLKRMALVRVIDTKMVDKALTKTYELTDAGRAAAEQGSSYYRK